jgi:hypothetical protein
MKATPRKGSWHKSAPGVYTKPIGAYGSIKFKTSVHAALKKYGLITERVKVFRKHRANILSELQETILNSIDLEDIETATLPARVLAFCKLYDKERLERDLSTANVATLHDDIASLKAKKLESEQAKQLDKAKK